MTVATKLLGQPSWHLETEEVEAYVTRLGGHLGPVTFLRPQGGFQPYSVAPWAEEELGEEHPAVIRALRGDFFCLPFGGNAEPWQGEQHPVHGETANALWQLESLSVDRDGGVALHASLDLHVRPGHVDKHLALRPGQHAVYCQHVVRGMCGRMDFGHHATLRFPDAPGSGLLSFSHFLYAQVNPKPTELPEEFGYSLLKPGAEIRDLTQVPTITGATTDLSRYPARLGFEDIAILIDDPEQPFAWSAAAFPGLGCVWFALKDPRVLAARLLWFSNRGRYYPPWNGRHQGVLGLEDITAYFHYGLAASAAANALTARGFRTCAELSPEQPLTVNYIMGAAAVPEDFGRVARIEPGPAGIVLVGDSGERVAAALDLDFLQRPPPPPR